MTHLRVTILGCGSSGGVPRLGGHWGDCDPENPRNRRRRCSALVERRDGGGVTSVLIDTSPDLRQQLLDAGVGRLDAVLYTHEHADHVHGLDDLRMIVFNMCERLPVWASPRTTDSLLNRFGYAFVQQKGSAYPPILDLNTIDGPITIDGAGGRLRFNPFDVTHGAIQSLGFRVDGLAYVPDASDIPEAARQSLSDLDVLIVDALRREPHPSHAHLEKTLVWIGEIAPRRAILTNMHIDLDYETVRSETPDHVEPAYDGMIIEVAS